MDDSALRPVGNDAELNDDDCDVLDLEEIFYSKGAGKPELTLMLSGKPITFLCDTGACKTVVKDIEALTKSNKAVLVKSANGQLQRQPLSKPVELQCNETGSSAWIQVIMAPECPCNLLGRDAMAKLRIGVFPTSDGGMTAQKSDLVNVLLNDQCDGQTVYYWTLDVPSDSSVGEELRTLATARALPGSDHRPASDMHIVLRSRSDTHTGKDMSNSDLKYNDQLHNLGSQKVLFTSLYWKGGTCFCDVKMPSEIDCLIPWGAPPHVLLTKELGEAWSDLSEKVQNARSVTDWLLDTSDEYVSNSTGWRKRIVNLEAKCFPNTRMYAEEA